MILTNIRNNRSVKVLLSTTVVGVTVFFYMLLTDETFIPVEIKNYNLQNGKWRDLSLDQFLVAKLLSYAFACHLMSVREFYFNYLVTWSSGFYEYLLLFYKTSHSILQISIQIQNLSNLGRILFLDEKRLPIQIPTIRYKILAWKYGKETVKRHIRNITNPFENCSVQNCELVYDDAEIEMADLVVFHLFRTKKITEIPTRTRLTQIWAFFTDESPGHTFLHRRHNDLTSYDNVFNWSMSYRMISDIPVPYGRTIELKTKNEKINITQWNRSKRQDVLVVVAMSNCAVKERLMYIKEMSKHIQVDFYGRCGNLTCPGHYHIDCNYTSKYKFYLSFENSNCDEYITEKIWWNGYHKNSIPIVMGAPKLSLQQSLPPNSYIDVNDFQSPGHLAKYLVDLNSSLSALEHFFEWKRDFEVLNEHGFFSSYPAHYCRICEALNYNSKQTKIYHNLKEFINVQSCR